MKKRIHILLIATLIFTLTGLGCSEAGDSEAPSTGSLYLSGNQSCFLNEDYLVCWGSQQHVMSDLANPTKAFVDGLTTCIKDDAGIKCLGSGEIETALESEKNVRSVAGKCWIAGGLKCLDSEPDPPNLIEPKQVVSGPYYCALEKRGVVCWGSNAYTPVLSNPTQLAAGGSGFCAIDDSGVTCWDNEQTGTNQVPPLNNPKQIAAGSNFYCALDKNGIQCWGDNQYGQSNPPDVKNVVSIAACRNHACAVDTKNVIHCWGANELGQTSGIHIPEPEPVTAFNLLRSSSPNATCWVDDAGILECSGNYNSITFFHPSGPISNPVALSVEDYHACLHNDDKVTCWGGVFEDEGGSWEIWHCGQTGSFAGPVQKMATGTGHTCVLRDGEIECRGEESNEDEPWNSACGSFAGATNVPPLANPIDLSAGSSHTCTIDDSGVVCWGNIESDKIPRFRNPKQIYSGGSNNCVVDDYGLTCWQNDGQLIKVPELSNIVDVSMDNDRICAISEGELYCWDENGYEAPPPPPEFPELDVRSY